MRIRLLTVWCFVGINLYVYVTPISAASGPDKISEVYSATIKGDFEEYKELLKLAISNRGIKISNTSFISDMLQRTREAVGDNSNIFVNAEAIEFCSATLSRQMMKADANNILYCPYIIYIYELATKPGIIHLAFRKIPETGARQSRKALEQVNLLLKGIIDETLE